MQIARKIGYISMSLIVLSLAACHPKVEPSSDMDKQLSCAELKSEIQRVKDVRARIERSRGFSARNVGLGIIFWPGVVINEVTGDSAESDANSKLVSLQNIYAMKQCSKEDCGDLANAAAKTDNAVKNSTNKG